MLYKITEDEIYLILADATAIDVDKIKSGKIFGPGQNGLFMQLEDFHLIFKAFEEYALDHNLKVVFSQRDISDITTGPQAVEIIKQKFSAAKSYFLI